MFRNLLTVVGLIPLLSAVGVWHFGFHSQAHDRLKNVAEKPALAQDSAPKQAPPPAKAPFSASEAKTHQEAWAKHLGEPVTKVNSAGITMVLIPPGEFLMGSEQSAEDVARIAAVDTTKRFDGEHPPHRVSISRPFYLSAHEVTQEQYKQVTGTNPSYFRPDGQGGDKVKGEVTDQLPVEAISWYDAALFCNLLSEKEGLPAYYELTDIERKNGSISLAKVRILGGKGYCLPTEAQWEYACRAGTTTVFHYGDKLNRNDAGCRFAYNAVTEGPYLGRTLKVGSYAPNAFGLFDMHGNVWEFCQDWHKEDYYKDLTAPLTTDPQGAPEGTRHVLRSGAYQNPAFFCRSAFRIGYPPDFRMYDLGLRLARVRQD